MTRQYAKTQKINKHTKKVYKGYLQYNLNIASSNPTPEHSSLTNTTLQLLRYLHHPRPLAQPILCAEEKDGSRVTEATGWNFIFATLGTLDLEGDTLPKDD